MNYEQLQAAYNQLVLEGSANRRAAAEQAAELATTRPLVEATNTFCDAWVKKPSDLWVVLSALNNLLALHRQQTSEVPSGRPA